MKRFVLVLINPLILLYTLLSQPPPCDIVVAPEPEEVVPVTPAPSPTPEVPIEKEPAWLEICQDIVYTHARHCSDYSKATVKRLRGEGYNAYCYSLRNEGIPGHIMVFIFDGEESFILEPQTGCYWKNGSSNFEIYIYNLLGYNPEIRTLWLPKKT